MDFPSQFNQISFASTAGGMAVLSTRVSGRVPTLHRLLVSSTAATRLRIQSATTGATADLVAASTGKSGWPLIATKLSLELAMEPRVEGSLRGLVGGNLQVGSTSVAVYGVAIVANTTMPAT